MDLFQKARAVRLRSAHDKYLMAEEDEESVTQDRNGSSTAAKWTVEFVENLDGIIRLKSCYGKYLTATNQPFLLGMTGRKVAQTLPQRLDSSLEWEPVREGKFIKLKTRYGQFLRANGGLPPWRNSVTHDVPHRTATQEWILWDVHVVEILVAQSPVAKPPPPLVVHSDSFASNSSPPSTHSSEFVSFSRQESPVAKPPPPLVVHSDSFASNSSPPFTHSSEFVSFSRQESNDSLVSSPPKGGEGRLIYFHIADEQGQIDEGFEELCTTFKGNEVQDLAKRLEEELGIDGVIVCTRSPLNGKLFPLRLQLPPNNATMHVIVVSTSSQVGQELAKTVAPF